MRLPEAQSLMQTVNLVHLPASSKTVFMNWRPAQRCRLVVSASIQLLFVSQSSPSFDQIELLPLLDLQEAFGAASQFHFSTLSFTSLFMYSAEGLNYSRKLKVGNKTKILAFI
jgi:hypothetical protein